MLTDTFEKGRAGLTKKKTKNTTKTEHGINHQGQFSKQFMYYFSFMKNSSSAEFF